MTPPTVPGMPVAPKLAAKIASARQEREDAITNLEHADRDLERLMRQAVTEGGSLREIAALSGVSHQHVANAVNGRPWKKRPE